ncbi:MAG TPA: Gfo/Idh/MocA family oxidoreductase [Terriglobia bacterium]|nr:Gfo/Idh/MocA family oxidoreductase [Terriglobia bacterium]
MQNPDEVNKRDSSRRSFLKTSGAVLAGGAIAARFGNLPQVHAAGSDEIRIGLIGCGERGTGAVENAFNAAPGVKLVAMADAFKDHLDKSLTYLSQFKEKVDVPEDRQFTGLGAFQKLLALDDVNYVILATPPGFRPWFIEETVAAGKNFFAEKPVGVDGPGIRTVLKAVDDAQAKGLHVGVGTQRHHQRGYIETLKRIHDGAIGDITEARVYWNQGPIWVHPKEQGWSDVEWQLRNWYYFTWLCGDHIVEQHVHNLDVANWATNAHPVSAVGLGGRQVRTAPEYGNIYDHFAIDYEYPGGIHVASYCRQMPHCENNVSEALIGTKGFCQVNKYTITGEKSWRLEGKDNLPYVQEHTDLIAAIRADKPYNELKPVAESTLTAILGRMAAYTGQKLTWDQVLNSSETLMPAKLEWGDLAVAPVAIPGQTQLS